MKKDRCKIVSIRIECEQSKCQFALDFLWLNFCFGVKFAFISEIFCSNEAQSRRLYFFCPDFIIEAADVRTRSRTEGGAS